MSKEVGVEPRTSALNMTLPAAAARALAAIDRYLLQAPELSSKPAARRCCCRSTGQTDGRTLDRAYLAPYTAASMSGQASKYIMVHGKRNVRAFLKDIFDAQ